MAYSKNAAAVNGVVELIIIALVMISGGSAGDYNGLTPNFYDKSCPEVLSIVRSVVEKAVAKEARMAASLLRLQFHDCFVQGCDGSLLLDDTPTFRGEKTAVPNNNSVRGFDVIDEIKREVESACPGVVSCADIIAIAARDSVVLSGGPEWSVAVGRRDSRGASLSGANRNIPAPNNTLSALITKFKRQGLDQVDLVALSGGHTIGQSRCTSFRQRLYNQTGKGEANLTIQSNYLGELKSACPISGGDNNLSPLDVVSPTQFNNHYFLNLKSGRGLLNSDVQLLYAGSNDQFITGLVDAYAADQTLFFNQFADSMVKMGSIKPLTGSMGEIRTNCRRMN